MNVFKALPLQCSYGEKTNYFQFTCSTLLFGEKAAHTELSLLTEGCG